MEREKRGTGRLTAAILFLITIYGFANTFQSVVMNQVVESYGLTGGQQGILSSMINVGCIVAMLTATLLQGRIRKTLLLLAAVILQALAFFALGIPWSLTGMIITGIVLGLGFGWADTCCNSAMVDVHPERSSFYLGLLHGGFGVGSLLCPLVVTAMLALMGWRQVSQWMGALMLFTALVFALLGLRRTDAGRQTVQEQKLNAGQIRAYLGNGRNLMLVLAGVMYAATQTGLTVWLVRYMTLRYQAESLGATALSIYWICATVSRFVAPRIRLKPILLFMFGALLSCVFQAGGVLVGNPVFMCVMVSGIGLVSGQCLPMLIGESTADYEGMTTLPTSVLLFTMCIARILMPLVMGVISDGVSVSGAMLAPAVTGLLAALAAFICFRMPMPKNEGGEAETA